MLKTRNNSKIIKMMFMKPICLIAARRGANWWKTSDSSYDKIIARVKNF